MRPHYSQSSRENTTPSSGTSPWASHKGVPSPDVISTELLEWGLHFQERGRKVMVQYVAQYPALQVNIAITFLCQSQEL